MWHMDMSAYMTERAFSQIVGVVEARHNRM